MLHPLPFDNMAPKKIEQGEKKNEKKNSGYSSDGCPVSSTDVIFTPSLTPLTEEQTQSLSDTFSNLTLSEKRKVAEKYETAIAVLQAQKKALGLSVKQINVKLQNAEKKDAKQTEDKPPSLRKSKEDMTVIVVIEDVRSNLTIKQSDRFGTLRQYVVRQWDMKADQKVSFDKLNGEPFPLHPKNKVPPNGSSYLYTFGVKNGDVIDISWVHPQPADVVDPDLTGIPIGGEEDADHHHVQETMKEMGWDEGTEESDDDDDAEDEVNDHEKQ